MARAQSGHFESRRGERHPDDEAGTLSSLLASVALHDEKAFNVLYSRAAPCLLGIARRILIRRELAEEVVQETFISIWRNAAMYRSDRAAPLTWMSVIARNHALDLLRRARRDEIRDDCIDDVALSEGDSGDPLTHVLMWDTMRRLDIYLHRLDREQRQAVTLAFLFEQSHAETAARLALPLGTIKSRIRRGLHAMSKYALDRE